MHDFDSIFWQFLSGRYKGSTQIILSKLDEISDTKEICHIYVLTGLALAQDQLVREKAWQTIESLIKNVNIDTVSNIQANMRKMHTVGEYRPIFKTEFQFDTQNIPISVLGMFSLNSNGYLREAAVKILSEKRDGPEIRYLLLRMNDWVPNISEKAIDAIAQRIGCGFGEYFVDNLLIVERLRDTQRNELENINALIKSEIRSESNRTSLKKVCFASNPKLARVAFSHLVAGVNQNFIDQDFITQCMQVKDIQIRQKAIQTAFDYIPNYITTHIERIFKDPTPSVRRMVLENLKNANSPCWREMMQLTLLDKNSALRNYARYNLPEIDIEKFYLSELEKPDGNFEFAIRGLIEIGKTPAEEVISRFTKSPFANIRSAAYAALFANTIPPSDQLVSHIILNEKKCCVSELDKYMKGKTSFVSVEVLLNLYQEARTANSRKTIIKMMARCNKWDCFPILLQIKFADAQDVQACVDSAIENWYKQFNKSFTQPNSEQLQKCQLAFEQYGKSLKTNQKKDFKFFLSTQKTIY